MPYLDHHSKTRLLQAASRPNRCPKSGEIKAGGSRKRNRTNQRSPDTLHPEREINCLITRPDHHPERT
jgi:hypothetical protein